MRYLAFLFMLFAFAANVAAEEQTLIKDNSEKRGFGGAVVKYTSVYDQGAVMIGGRGGWIFNHSLVLGGGGYGVVSEVDAPEGVMPEQAPLDIEFGYGGFEVEYIIHPNSLGHFSLYTLFGAGDIHYVKDVGPVSKSNQTVGKSDFVFVIEPAVNGELNVTTWFRVNAGVTYRLVTDVEQEALKSGDFRGVSATLTLKFGRF
jgi:hypothetical protein